MPFLLALDQGTTSSRALLFDAASGALRRTAQRGFAQHFPQPGWVEHDAHEILATQMATAREVLQDIAPAEVAAIGLSNQRETLVLWDAASGRALTPALVWQDRRTEPLCQQWRAAGLHDTARARTGLPLDPYFSAPKAAWWWQQQPAWREQAAQGRLRLGTIDSWLLWHLTEGRVHATDVTNASRTQWLHLQRGEWDDELLALLGGTPRAALPDVRPSAGAFGHTGLLGGSIALTGIAGDQQAALHGQGCTQAGQAKATYGTGCFLLQHTGTQCKASRHGLLTTRAAQGTGQAPQFALEGSVFMAGALVQWLRDGLGLIERSADIEPLAASVPDAGGLHLVPAFTGLGAPYWDAEARGAILGLTRGSTRAHIARAALEAIAWSCAELLDALAADAGEALQALRVDGGASANALLMQLQADAAQCAIERPALLEATALGAACLAAQGAGLDFVPDLGALQVFRPQRDASWRAQAMAGWRAAVARVRSA